MDKCLENRCSPRGEHELHWHKVHTQPGTPCTMYTHTHTPSLLSLGQCFIDMLPKRRVSRESKASWLNTGSRVKLQPLAWHSEGALSGDCRPSSAIILIIKALKLIYSTKHRKSIKDSNDLQLISTSGFLYRCFVTMSCIVKNKK